MTLFPYDPQQWFNTDSIEHFLDTGEEIHVTLKSGKRICVREDDRDRFYDAVRPISYGLPNDDFKKMAGV